MNPARTHPCGHGGHVLEADLVTHKGTFGPGTFVWFPVADAMVLSVTNKSFRIDHVE